MEEWTTAGVIGKSSPSDWPVPDTVNTITLFSVLGPTWPTQFAWMVEAADWSADQFGGGVSLSRVSEIIVQSLWNDGRSSGL